MAAIHHQILVRLLDGRTQCLQISAPTISGETLKNRLSSITNIPPSLQRLVSGPREVSDETILSASTNCDGLFPSVTLLLRLRGGKGGFGSLLRGAATKAGQKKTNNFDACRDMSGRRLRHVNAEKRLKEWRAEAEDRRLEKVAEEFLKKKSKEIKKKNTGEVEKYVEKYREDAAKCSEVMEESVRQSFELYKAAKRKLRTMSGPESGPEAKRLKIWMGKKNVQASDDDDSDEGDDLEDIEDGDEKSVVLDDGNCKIEAKNGEESNGLISVGHSDEESSGGGSEKSNLEEENGNGEVGFMEVGEGTGSGDGNADSDASVEPEAAKEETVGFSLEESPDSNELRPAIERPVEPEIVHEGKVEQTNGGASNEEEPLDFNLFNSASELEALGMERLKMELQAHGMKCGGTLQERAARLFLLKTTPLEKLPKKVLAKPTAK